MARQESDANRAAEASNRAQKTRSGSEQGTATSHSAWAILAPNGRVMLETVGRTRPDAIDNFYDRSLMHFVTWSAHRRRGYRCVRVALVIGGE